MRALVREGSDAIPLSEQGVEIVRGDLVDPASLEPALDGVDALVTTAAGYVLPPPSRFSTPSPTRSPE